MVLRHLLELTPAEIAAVVGVPRGTVNSRLRRGLDSARGPARPVLIVAVAVALAAALTAPRAGDRRMGPAATCRT